MGDEPSVQHNDPKVWGPRLRRIAHEQLDSALTLDQLSRVQSDAARRNQSDQVVAILTQREPCVSRLAELGEQLRPYLEEGGMAGLLGRLPSHERDELEDCFGRVRSILGMVAERDQADRSLLEDRRRAIAEELGALAAGRGANSAYGPGGAAVAGSAPMYQDRMG